MIKYAVIKVRALADETSDFEDIGIFDTEDEAFEKAEEVFSNFTFEEQMSYGVEIGEVAEEDLDDKDDWHSYRKIEITNILAH